MEVEIAKKSEKGSFKPVTLTDGTVVEATYTKGEKKSIHGEIKKGGKTVGSLWLSEEQDRMHFQINSLSSVTDGAVSEGMTLFAGFIEALNNL